jgi:hypothetical protein
MLRFRCGQRRYYIYLTTKWRPCPYWALQLMKCFLFWPAFTPYYDIKPKIYVVSCTEHNWKRKAYQAKDSYHLTKDSKESREVHPIFSKIIYVSEMPPFWFEKHSSLDLSLYGLVLELDLAIVVLIFRKGSFNLQLVVVPDLTKYLDTQKELHIVLVSLLLYTEEGAFFIQVHNFNFKKLIWRHFEMTCSLQFFVCFELL